MKRETKAEGGQWIPEKSNWEKRMESRSPIQKWRDRKDFWDTGDRLVDQLADDCNYDIRTERKDTARRRALWIAAAIIALLLLLWL
ncbi:MAG: hypothetical protein EOM65_04920 [Synergistales bacterium]|nr:hypothetical protein [Synergistales bacterium]